MKNTNEIPQLFLRFALGLGFILPVMDRIGWIDKPGSTKVAWGDWTHFIDYTNSLMPFLGRSAANVMGFTASLAEATIGICLLLGFKIKLASLGGALITLSFAICMMATQGIYAPFQYPVFVFTGACLVLSRLDNYKWSFDNILK
ncbi:DoxX family membrane protein [Flavobacterium sp. 5]|uniref:DoxX family membrane protein n=1 Tax=Flavobacterium sp. 5 TaxID=2035199 RepID=UPI000C2BA831|nr:DoxX family membrane protein [Flavobacterium sp. 5]PKB17607.1 DoxX-like protein [Flavobacterium sp. 5]